MRNGASYLVVQGQKGVGKSCLVDTVLYKEKGVMCTKISPGTIENDGLKKCFHEIAGSGSTFFDERVNAKRVLFWYNLLFRSDQLEQATRR